MQNSEFGYRSVYYSIFLAPGDPWAVLPSECSFLFKIRQKYKEIDNYLKSILNNIIPVLVES